MDKLFQEAPNIQIDNNSRLVIISDIHIGNAGPMDEFVANSEMFAQILDSYYRKEDYTLVLNGDIEELYKYHLKDIVENWPDIYSIFGDFADRDKLIKIFGNHDYELKYNSYPDINKSIQEAVKLRLGENTIFIFHGHQCSGLLQDYNLFSRTMVRYFADIFRIKNTTFTLDEKKIFDTELRSYWYSASRKMISIIGHTHKPLFESQSKKDNLIFRIEKLLRKYKKSGEGKKHKIRRQIDNYKKELKSISSQKQTMLRNALYKDELLLPLLFNSGAVIGKRGMTAIEIDRRNISLVYWFDINRSNRYIDYKGIKIEQHANTNFYKAVLKTAELEEIFTRIKLLT